MGRHLRGFDVDLQSAVALTRDRHGDDSLGDVHPLEFVALPEPDEPRLAALDDVECLTDEHRLGAGPTDPSMHRAIRGDDRP